MTRDQKADRLAHARKHAGYETAADAARAFGWDEYTYRSHESGRRPYNDEQALGYGKAFRAPPEWLLFGRGAPQWAWPKIISHVGAGAEVFPESEPFDEIEPPPGAGLDAFALIVRGDSMSPAMNDGDILICEWRTDPSDYYGKTMVVDLEDGRRLVKKLARGPSADTFSLIGLDASIIEGVRLVRAAEVIWRRMK